MNIELLPKYINSIGLVFDIAGAWLVAWEVVRQYKGQQYGTGTVVSGLFSTSPPKTNEYKKWERNKYIKMKIGLCLLTIGFLFQIGSNWIYSGKNNDKPNNTQEINNPIKPTVTNKEEPSPLAKIVNKPKHIKPIPDK
jgi:hypothetical protein